MGWNQEVTVTELDRLLDEARPTGVGSTPMLRNELNRLVMDTQRHTRGRRRRGFRIAAAAGAFAVIAGGGTVAVGSGLMPTPSTGHWEDEPSSVHVTMTLPSGQRCTAIYTVVPVEVQKNSANKALWQDAYRVATDEMKRVDPDEIPIHTAVRIYNEYDEKVRAEQARTLPPEEIAPRGRPDEIQVRAVGAYIFEGVQTELRRAGMPDGLLTMSSGDDCTPPGAFR